MRTEKKAARLPLFGLPEIAPYLRKYRGLKLRTVLVGGAVSAVDALYPLFNRYALDTFVGGRTMRGVVPFILLYLASCSYRPAELQEHLRCGRIEMLADRDLRAAAFDHLQTLSFSYFNRNSVGYLHARVMTEHGLIGEAVSWRMMKHVWSGAYVLGS